VLDVLREKHPDARIPEENAFDHYANSADVLDEAMPIACYEEQISLRAAHLRGGAGPCGVDGTMLKEWLLRHEVSSERLREEMAHWVVWLSNDSPPFAAYRAVNSARMLAADKKPGVRPLACGEIWMRLWADCLNTETKVGATTACGNVNLCAGLRAGIEGNLHAVRAVWPQSAGWERDGGEVAAPMPVTEGTSMAVTRATDPGEAADVSRSRYVPDSGFGTALFDAKNGFNEVNRYLMLWTAAHCWTKASRFAFNRYRHQNIVFVRDRPGTPPIRILSREGIAQGCSLSMNLYGVALLPLLKRMRVAVPDALAPAYADDTAAAGKAVHNAACLSYLMRHGPRYGYFPEPGKSWYICKAEDEAVARQVFEANDLDIQFSRGQRYLGGFIGSNASKVDWLGSMVTTWVAAVETLASVAGNYPQAAYAGLTFSLQNEWQYVQRVTSDTAAHFAPLEVAIRTKFLPALLGIAASDLDGEFRELLTHGVKTGGIAIRNPVDTAVHVHETSLRATSHLVTSMVDPEAYLNLEEHRECVTRWGQYGREERLKRERKFLDARGIDKPAVKRRDILAGAAGLWLSVIPDRLNGNSLSAEEFRDNLRLRYNLLPLDMPQLCDGCGAPMTVEHALCCKVGGLVHIRHDDVADEWRHLCGCALSFGRVEREPRIYSSVSRQQRLDASSDAPSGEEDDPTTPTDQTPPTGERGDASAHGFWQRGRTAIFDVRITDTQSRSYRNKDYQKVLAQQEKEKKNQYLRPCLEMRKDFTPLVYSVDGIAGREAKNAEKRLAYHLSEKWHKQLPQMVYYVRIRMAIAVVRANSLLIRGSRDRQRPRRPVISDRHAMNDWRTWSEQ
jgi:hypothetical protein